MVNTMVDEFEASNGITLHYTMRDHYYDFNHTLLVFSGFPRSDALARPLGDYDFGRALRDYPGRIVWIDDFFNDAYGYYIASGGGLDPADAVQEFIAYLREEYDLSSGDFTATGFSKGGSAALYHGIRAGIRNIVITVPQIRIGSYVHEAWPKVAPSMMGEGYSEDDCARLDAVIPNLVCDVEDKNRHIYLLTSRVDPQFEEEIVPILPSLEEYSGFHLIETASAFVRRHNEVTRHHTSLLLGLYYLLANELVPTFDGALLKFEGRVGEMKALEPSADPVAVLNLERLEMEGSLLHVEGSLVLMGYPQERYADARYTLILQGEGEKEHRFQLGSLLRPELTRTYNKDTELCIPYDTAYFATMGRKGIDVDDVPAGKYRMFIQAEVRSNGWIAVTVPLHTDNWLLGTVADSQAYFIDAGADSVIVEKLA